jgi:putative two-component system response regulator
MFVRFAKENKLLIATALVLFAGAIVATSFLTSRLYQAEAGWRHANAASQTTSAKRIIEATFSGVLHDMHLLSLNPYLVAYAESGFSPRLQPAALKALRDSLGMHAYYVGLSLADLSGRSRVSLGAEVLPGEVHGQAGAASEGDNRHDPSGVFVKRPAGGSATAREGSATTLLVLAAIRNAEDVTLGKLVLGVDLARMLDVLSPGIFIEGWDGNWVFLGDDGVVRTSPPIHSLHAHTGDLTVSKDETIHHLTASLGGQGVVVGLRHIDPQLASRLSQLTWVGAALLGVFLVLGMFIVYSNSANFQESIEAQKALVYSLAKLASRRDEITGAHLERTRDYAVALANKLKESPGYRQLITSRFLEDLYDAAPLHDIGKVGISDTILHKPSKLTSDEFHTMQSHVEMGAQVLGEISQRFKLKRSLYHVAYNICACHHEKYDGSGYPAGLKGQDIPLEARIFTICDVYDVIRSKRPYKEPLSHAEAIKAIQTDSGSHFDPEIVDAFLNCGPMFSEICLIHTEDSPDFCRMDG